MRRRVEEVVKEHGPRADNAGMTTTHEACPREVPAAGASFVARHPIYDRALAVYAYELRFRGEPDDDAVAAVATADALDELVHGRRAAVSVTRRFVLAEYALLVPADRLALEVVDEIDGDVAAKLRHLAAQGYVVVVEAGDAEALHPDLVAAATLVKVPVAGRSSAELAAVVAAARGGHAKLLALGVDDYECYELCRGLGFDLFSGSFFVKPRVVGAQGIPPHTASRVQLVALLQDPDVALEELEAIISRDVGLAYRLLRYLNSGYFFRQQTVTSIHEALLRLGQRRVRAWSTLIVLDDIEHRPDELLVTAMIRGRLCELAAAAAGRAPVEPYYTVGLFSLIDAFMDAALPDLVSVLPFAPEIVGALLDGTGPYADVLGGVVAYAEGRFESADELLPGIDLRALYLDALAWAEENRNALAALR